jgi:predicted AlkP superfamily phosphohydrolase/phosphomutase
MLSNAVLAAALAATFVLTLVLQLNPTLSLEVGGLVTLAMTVGLFYLALLTLIFCALIGGRQLVVRDRFSPAWVSVGVLAWLAAAAALAGAALMWANVRTFGLVLEPETVRRMALGSLTLVMAAALFALTAIVRAHTGPTGRPVWGTLFVLVWMGSAMVPLAIRGRGVPPLPDPRPIGLALDVDATEPRPRLTMIAIDAGSLDFITSAAAEGRLPNFGRILDVGAVMHLATVHPTSAEAVWAAAATGKLPQKNGIRSGGSYRLRRGGDPILLLPDFCFAQGLVRVGLLIEQPHDSSTPRTHPFWDILDAAGIPAGVIGWPLTSPAPDIRGYIVSDVDTRLMAGRSGPDDPSAVSPASLGGSVPRAVETAEASTPRGPRSTADRRRETADRVDRLSDRLIRELDAARPVPVTIVRYQSLDAMGHYFLRYAQPAEFGDVTDEERRRFGSVLEQHYAFVDQAVGRAMASLGPDDLLLVVSGYGMEPLGLLKRLIERLAGDAELSGTHERAPDGFLMAYGGPVARNRVAARGSIVDIVPTVLYFLGLPIGRDMDGYVRTDLFQPSFTEQRPITFIPTYDR